MIRRAVYLTSNLAHPDAVHDPITENDYVDQNNHHQRRAFYLAVNHLHMSSRHPMPFARQLNRKEK